MTMLTEKRTLLTVITESAIEKVLLRDLDNLGVRGYTVSDARGRGVRGVRDASREDAANIRIEVICTRALADVALQHIHDHYYVNYGMVAFMQDVEIIRVNKF